MKTIYALILMAFFSVGLAGQVSWVKHEQPVLENGNPGSWDEATGFPSVLKLDDTYHMWYGGVDAAGSMKVGYATSTDGESWEKYENNPVLSTGEPGSLDDTRAYLAHVVYDGSVFHMYYVGAASSGNENLLYATSEDGIEWLKNGAPEFQYDGGDPYEGRINRGDVYFDGDEFHMWAGMSARGIYDVGYATSADGATWTVIDSLVMDKPLSGDWEYPRVQVGTVFEMGDEFHMWYSGGDLLDWDIGYATSPDGLEWTKDDDNPVLTRGGSVSWDEGWVAFPTVFHDPSDLTLKMWYSGSPTSGVGGIGFASIVISNSGHELVQDRKEGDLVLYPNPARTWFNVETGLEDEVSLEILSINGQVLFMETLQRGTRGIDVSGIPRGLYIVKLTMESKILTGKLLVE